MTRLDQIASLTARYDQYTKLGKRKAAGEVYARLKSLVERQLRAELRARPKDRAVCAAIVQGDTEAAELAVGAF